MIRMCHILYNFLPLPRIPLFFVFVYEILVSSDRQKRAQNHPSASLKGMESCAKA